MVAGMFEFGGSDGDGLAVIARRECHDASGTFCFRQRKRKVCRAAHLECAAALEILAFEEAVYARSLIEPM